MDGLCGLSCATSSIAELNEIATDVLALTCRFDYKCGMTSRVLSLSNVDVTNLRAGLSFARVSWRDRMSAGNAEWWAQCSAESMRLSAELYRMSDSPDTELIVRQISADCLSAAAAECEASPDPIIAALATTMRRVSADVRVSFGAVSSG
jgi:hypothetical protein